MVDRHGLLNFLSDGRLLLHSVVDGVGSVSVRGLVLLRGHPNNSLQDIPLRVSHLLMNSTGSLWRGDESWCDLIQVSALRGAC